MLTSTPNSIVTSLSTLPLNRDTQTRALAAAETNPQGTEVAVGDQLSLSPLANQFSVSDSSARLSLSLRSHARVRELPNGQVLARVNTKLRFEYEFEAADGTSIRIRLNANLQYRQRSLDGDQIASTKLSVRARVEWLQQDVASELAPLQDAQILSDETKQALSFALGIFQQSVDVASAQFSESDELDGDSLIASLVDAFNGLSSLLDSAGGSAESDQALPIPVEPAALPAAEVREQPAPEPLELPAPAPELVEPETQELPPVDTPAEEPAAVPAEPASESDAQQDATSSIRLATFKARLYVMQRLTQVVDAFGDDVVLTTRQMSYFRLQASVVQVLAAGDSATESDPSTPSDNAIDVQA